jgi:hypothetical protein
MNEIQANNEKKFSPSRRGFLKRIGHDLPLFSSGFSATLAWIYESWVSGHIANFLGETKDRWTDVSIVDSVSSLELPVQWGAPMTFVWISHVPSQALQIWQKIDQILQGQDFDVVLTEGHLEKYLPPRLQERAIDIDRSPSTLRLISLISYINLAICYKLRIKSDWEKYIKRRLALMYFLTVYNFSSPLDLLKSFIEKIFWENNIPPFLVLDYVRDGRSVFMLQECIKNAREWKKVLFLSGGAHTSDAQWYCDHPEIFEIKKRVNEFMYRWLHEAGR